MQLTPPLAAVKASLHPSLLPALALAGFLLTLPLPLLAGAGQAPGAIAARSPAEYRALLALSPPPAVALPQPSAATAVKGKHHRRIPERYDVAKIGARRVDAGVNFYSLDRELAMGKQLAHEWESQCQLLHDSDVTAYIDSLAQRLVRHSDAKVPFTVKVVDNDEVNAFALPGGYFYVNTGLILAARNEAELAGVMAHEIAHVAARHATRNLTRSELWNIASVPLILAGGPVGMAVREVTSLAVPMGTLKFGRDAEREADLLGLEYAYAAGYDPMAFVNFFERLGVKPKRPSFMAKAFATHPMNADRVRRAEEAIRTMLPPQDEYVLDTSEFGEIQARLVRMLNAYSVVGGDGRPVLRRRDGAQAGDPSQSGDDGRPQLHRR